MDKNDVINLEKDYNISFFRPTTKVAKFNRNLILVLFSIWAVAIFGFQIWLKVIETPTPEIAFTEYQSVWENIKLGSASDIEKQVFIKSALSVLGKVTLAPIDRAVLNSSVSKLTLELVPEVEKNAFLEKINAFKALKYGELNYLDHKKDLANVASSYIGVENFSLEGRLIPLELAAASSANINSEKVEAVMAKYLIHNQSYLTDSTFLGFPFHYFYTAVFLLILFVLLCLYYCVATDRAMRKLGIEQE